MSRKNDYFDFLDHLAMELPKKKVIAKRTVSLFEDESDETRIFIRSVSADYQRSHWSAEFIPMQDRQLNILREYVYAVETQTSEYKTTVNELDRNSDSIKDMAKKLLFGKLKEDIASVKAGVKSEVLGERTYRQLIRAEGGYLL
jgi:hypothetical protein